MATYEHFTGKLAIEALSPSFLVFSRGLPEDPAPARQPPPCVSLVAAAVGLVVTAPLMAVDRAGHQARLPRAGLLHPRAGGLPRATRSGSSSSAPCASQTGAQRQTRSGTATTGAGSRGSDAGCASCGSTSCPSSVNILKGDMDLVGPRPEIVENIKLMAELVPYYALRHVVRPGLTGWAQVRYGYSVEPRAGHREDAATTSSTSSTCRSGSTSASWWIPLKIALFGRGAR